MKLASRQRQRHLYVRLLLFSLPIRGLLAISSAAPHPFRLSLVCHGLYFGLSLMDPSRLAKNEHLAHRDFLAFARAFAEEEIRIESAR
jgi:hypothetical protein